jgi:chromosome segregation ATPase
MNQDDNHFLYHLKQEYKTGQSYNIRLRLELQEVKSRPKHRTIKLSDLEEAIENSSNRNRQLDQKITELELELKSRAYKPEPFVPIPKIPFDEQTVATYQP